jgi:hypothetical protein
VRDSGDFTANVSRIGMASLHCPFASPADCVPSELASGGAFLEGVAHRILFKAYARPPMLSLRNFCLSRRLSSMETIWINGNFASLPPKSFGRSLGRQDLFYQRTLAAQMNVARTEHATFEIAELVEHETADEQSTQPQN